MTRRLRIPRRSLHLQLTLLYAVPFLISGIVLLAIPLLGTQESVSAGSGGSGGEPHLDKHMTNSAVEVGIMVVVALALGWFVAGRFLRPLRTITAAARDISATNLHRRLGRTGLHDEFTELAETLDELFGRLETSFDAQRYFVANASHELRTPLTAERTVLQVALADPGATTETLRAACHEVLALGEQQERLIAALLTLAEGQQAPHVRAAVDLAEIAAAHRPSPEALRVEPRIAPARVAGDPALIERLVTNLIDNAVRHNTPGGWIRIDTGTHDGRGVLRVANSGPVIPPAELEALFQPFRQLGGRRTRQGHGLGLAIVRAIATSHGASITARPQPAGGLDIEITFPAVVPR